MVSNGPGNVLWVSSHVAKNYNSNVMGYATIIIHYFCYNEYVIIILIWRVTIHSVVI